MIWLEIIIETTDEGMEPLCAALLGAGIDAVSIEESRETVAAGLRRDDLFWDYAALESLGADTPRVRAYLPDLPESLPRLDAARAAVAALPTLCPDMNLGSLHFSVSKADEADWADTWKQFWGSTPVGERLMVLPSWESAPQTEREILLLDPGMAFGTGTHETTRLCLELLDELVHEGDHVLDLGCGSGILSIAAVKLGAREVTAVDIDPVAERVTRENAARNNIEDCITVLAGNVLTDAALAQRVAGCYRVILSNIVADIVIALSPVVKPWLAEGGVWILSGIIGERVPDVETALKKQGYEIVSHLNEADWHAFCAVLSPPHCGTGMS